MVDPRPFADADGMPDSDPLAPVAFASYLVRTENVCGHGPTGLYHEGLPRIVISCPKD